MFDRRQVLKGAVGAAFSLAVPLAGSRVLAADAKVLQLSDSLYLLQGLGTNVVAKLSDDGLLLVDSGAPAHRDTLLQQLSNLSGTGVNTLINTHYHPDQSGANEVLGEQGATILAHARCKQWMSAPYYVPSEDRYVPARPPQACPSETFYDKKQLQVDGEQIDLGYLVEAHTNSDIYVWFREANVLLVGDVASPEVDPTLDWFTGGWIGGRRDALDDLLDISNEETRIVPARGQVMSRAELLAEHDMMVSIYDRAVEMVRQGFGPQDMLEAGVLDGLQRSFDDPDKFMYDLCKGLWAHHNKLNHNVV